MNFSNRFPMTWLVKPILDLDCSMILKILNQFKRRLNSYMFEFNLYLNRENKVSENYLWFRSLAKFHNPPFLNYYSIKNSICFWKTHFSNPKFASLIVVFCLLFFNIYRSSFVDFFIYSINILISTM